MTTDRFSFRPAVLIPVYNHETYLENIIVALSCQRLPIVLIDDGSHRSCAQKLRYLANAYNNVTLICHAKNAGKGAATITGFECAFNAGFSHVLQIDADGQHDLAAVEDFLKTARENPLACICGFPLYDQSVPKARLKGRKITNWWVHINTLSSAIKDALCGFRVYPLAPVMQLLRREHVGQRMDFDAEILVRLLWQETPIINRAVHVTYPKDGISHFRLLQDNLAISGMHAKLFLGMLYRLPHLLRHSAQH